MYVNVHEFLHFWLFFYIYLLTIYIFMFPGGAASGWPSGRGLGRYEGLSERAEGRCPLESVLQLGLRRAATRFGARPMADTSQKLPNVVGCAACVGQGSRA